MKVKIIAVGKLKEKYLKDGIAEYRKRMSRFTKFEMIELPDEQTPDKASEAQNQQIMEKEGDRILAKLYERDYVIILAIEGEMLSSEAFSQVISDATVRGYSSIAVVIGGSLGVADKVKQKANLKFGFGKMTVPHQLMHLVLSEQIYRAFMIQQGSPYHK